jgi:hypothetical protein
MADLGWEPQYILIKRAEAEGAWYIFDSMRGISTGGADPSLVANLPSVEEGSTNWINLTSTGFVATSFSGTNIYIAIRRGPMKVPTTGASVFAAQATRAASNGTPSQNSFTSNFPVDMMIQGFRNGDGATAAQFTLDRLRGSSPWLATTTTGAENANTTYSFASQNGVYPTTSLGATNMCGWMFRRAPGFFDEVCYTGTGGTQTLSHNLGVAPELAIVKDRSQLSNWTVCQYTANKEMLLESANAAYGTVSTIPNPTTTTIQVKFSTANLAGDNFVLYLFASCPGVSKVFSYTGNGSSQTINCGFTGGARFVMIKRTDDTGDWYVWDTARGIVSGNDPHLSLNTTAAEVTTDDTIDTDSTGFVVNQVSATNVNVSSATYIFLAIA